MKGQPNYKSTPEETMVLSQAISMEDLESELQDVKVKGTQLKEKLNHLRREEYNEVKAELDFCKKVSEMHREKQCHKAAFLFLTRSGEAFHRELVTHWNKFAVSERNIKAKEKAEQKRDHMRGIALHAFHTGDANMNKCFVFESWRTWIKDQKVKTKFHQHETQFLKYRLQKSMLAQKALNGLAATSDFTLKQNYFHMWYVYLKEECPRVKALEAARNDLAGMATRLENMKNHHHKSLLSGSATRRLRMFFVVWSKYTAGQQYLRTALEYKKEIDKLKLVSIPLLLSLTQKEADGRWKNKCVQVLGTLAKISIGRYTKSINFALVYRSFQNWVHDWKDTKSGNILRSLNNEIANRTKKHDSDWNGLKRKSQEEMSLLHQQHTDNLRATKDGARDEMSRMSKSQSDRISQISIEFDENRKSIENSAQKNLDEVTRRMSADLANHKNKAVADLNAVKKQSQDERDSLMQKLIKQKKDLLDTNAKMLEKQADEFNKGRERQEAEHAKVKRDLGERLKNLEKQEADMQEDNKTKTNERDGAWREVEMYQNELRNLQRAFGHFKDRAVELEMVQKDDILALEQFVEQNIPGAPKFLLGMPQMAPTISSSMNLSSSNPHVYPGLTTSVQTISTSPNPRAAPGPTMLRGVPVHTPRN